MTLDSGKVKFVQILKSSWQNWRTLEEWSLVFRQWISREDAMDAEHHHLNAMMHTWNQDILDIISHAKSCEEFSWTNFIDRIFDSELYTAYIRDMTVNEHQIRELLSIYNEISTGPYLSSPITKNTTMSSTIAIGQADHADVPESGVSSNHADRIDDIDTIARSLAPHLGPSTTGSIFSSISIQQADGLTQLKYPEGDGFGLVEVNIARFSKVQHLDSNEAWKAYDFRTKMVVSGPLDPIHIQATRLIRTISDRLKNREDCRKTVFRLKSEDQSPEGHQHQEYRQRGTKRTRKGYSSF